VDSFGSAFLGRDYQRLVSWIFERVFPRSDGRCMCSRTTPKSSVQGRVVDLQGAIYELLIVGIPLSRGAAFLPRLAPHCRYGHITMRSKMRIFENPSTGDLRE